MCAMDPMNLNPLYGIAYILAPLGSYDLRKAQIIKLTLWLVRFPISYIIVVVL